MKDTLNSIFVTKGNKPHNLKQSNRQAVLSLLHQNSEMTIPEVSVQTGLSRTAATKIVNELCAENFLYTSSKRNAGVGGGKRPALFAINEDYKYTIVIAGSDTSLVCSVADMNCKVRMCVERPCTKREQGDHEVLVHLVSQMVFDVMDRMQIGPDAICAIVIGLKGILNEQRGVNLFPIGGRGSGFSFQEELIRVLEFEPVILAENACRFSGYAELMTRPLLRRQTVVVVSTGPSNFGGCVIDRGVLWHGAGGLAGEVGHMTVDPFSRRVCECGNRGCFSSLVSEAALLDHAFELAPRFPDSRIAGAALARNLTEGDIFAMADEDDPLACRVIDRVVLYFSTVIHNITMLVDPDQVILQGRYCRAGAYFQNGLLAKTHVFPQYTTMKPPPITVSGLEDEDEFLIGATFYAVNRCLFGGGVGNEA